MPEPDKSPWPGGDKQLEDIFNHFFGDGSAGPGDGLDEAAKREAERKAQERKIEDAYGGGKKGASLPKWLLSVLVLVVVIGGLIVNGMRSGGREQRTSRPPSNAQAEAAARRAMQAAQNRARMEESRTRAAQASAQARQRAEEATRRINEIQQQARGGDISVAAEANGSRVIIPLLSGWKTAPQPQAGEDGYRPLMAFTPPGREGILYAVSAPAGDKADASFGGADPLASVRAKFPKEAVVETGKETLTVVVPRTGGAGDVRDLHSFLLVNDALVRLSALNVPLSPGTMEIGLRTLRMWRAAFGRVNPAAKPL